MNNTNKINRLVLLAKQFLAALFVLLTLAPLTICADEPRITSAIATLNLASTDWCPYSCDDPGKPGFITEAMTQALANYDISLSVSILPWSRAIKMTEQGNFDGLLIAIPGEAPGFRLTEKPSGQNNNCLFSLPDSVFTYHDRGSLNGVVLGAIQDYRYGKPIDDIIDAPVSGEQIYFLSSSKPLYSLVEMTYKNRIGTFVEDRLVLGNYLQSHKNRPLKNVGCLERAPLFTAISPSYKKHKEVITLLNKLLDSEDYKSLYKQAEQRYTGNYLRSLEFTPDIIR
tara:strand:+ start:1247 stop:2098 length:852 start_codon:yes stop_codon:yes gene_type:complete